MTESFSNDKNKFSNPSAPVTGNTAPIMNQLYYITESWNFLQNTDTLVESLIHIDVGLAARAAEGVMLCTNCKYHIERYISRKRKRKAWKWPRSNSYAYIDSWSDDYF